MAGQVRNARGLTLRQLSALYGCVCLVAAAVIYGVHGLTSGSSCISDLVCSAHIGEPAECPPCSPPEKFSLVWALAVLALVAVVAISVHWRRSQPRGKRA